MKTKTGFTLVELSLATVFVATLLIMIATITINMTTIYQKGVTLRNVNSTGRILIDEFGRAIADGPLIRLPEPKDDGDIDMNNYYYSGTINAQIARQSSAQPTFREVQSGGIFCSGRYSYVWNTGYVLNAGRYGVTQSPVTLRYKMQGRDDVIRMGESDEDRIYLIKFADPDRVACKSRGGVSVSDNPVVDISSMVLSSAPEELLSKTEGQLRLALYELTVFPVVQDSVSLRSFYSGTFILATETGDVDIKSSGDYCDPAGNQSLASDFSYCAVNKFNFAAQASGE